MPWVWAVPDIDRARLTKRLKRPRRLEVEMNDDADAGLAIEPLVSRLRRLEGDHTHGGYPAVTMAEVSALLNEIEALWGDRGPGRTCPDCGSFVRSGWIHGCG
jgi:hypothetical protein